MFSLNSSILCKIPTSSIFVESCLRTELASDLFCQIANCLSPLPGRQRQETGRVLKAATSATLGFRRPKQEMRTDQEPGIRCEPGGGQGGTRSPGVSCQLSLDTVTHCADCRHASVTVSADRATLTYGADGFKTIAQYIVFPILIKYVGQHTWMFVCCLAKNPFNHGFSILIIPWNVYEASITNDCG